jgi:translation initiation factor IF-3
MAHKEFGYQIIDRLKNDLQEFGALESDPQMEGRFLVAFFAPKSK